MAVFDDERCTLYDKKDLKVEGTIIGTATRVEGLYKLDINGNIGHSLNTKVPDYDLWHRRLGHPGSEKMKILSSDPERGVVFSEKTDAVCVDCVKGKKHRNPFPKSTETKASDILEIIHSDLCGPFPSSYSGSKYMLSIIRRGSRDIFGGGELGSFRLPTLHSLPTFLETGKIAFLFALQVN